MLTQSQHKEFAVRGFVKVNEAFPSDIAVSMVNRIWTYLGENQGIQRHDPTTWVEGGIRGTSGLKKEPEFQRFASPVIVSIIDDLLGQGAWCQPSAWGQVLATFPAPEWTWNSLFQGLVDMETILWHTDYPYDIPPDELAGVQVFAILADLDSGGGGTMVIEGSHRVAKGFIQKQAAEVLSKMKRARVALMDSHPWLQSVSQAVSMPRPEEWIAEQTAVIDGVSVSINELTGKAGDVYFTHPWLLHAPSPNCNQTPRLMSTQRIQKLKYKP